MPSLFLLLSLLLVSHCFAASNVFQHLICLRVVGHDGLQNRLELVRLTRRMKNTVEGKMRDSRGGIERGRSMAQRERGRDREDTSCALQSFLGLNPCSCWRDRGRDHVHGSQNEGKTRMHYKSQPTTPPQMWHVQRGNNKIVNMKGTSTRDQTHCTKLQESMFDKR